MFSQSDIVTLHTPLTSETRGLIDKKLLSLMQTHAMLVNVARGGLIDEDSLVHHLREKKIRGAALDVYAKEPLSNDSPLRSLTNVVITPHLGASTQEAQYRVGQMAVDQIKEFFFNGKVLNEVHAL